MRVKVEQLRPNPFRHMKDYPIDREKVEALKISIEQTDFWDNILGRETPLGVEIAYGHHRLVAIRELGITEVDIPVKDLDDATMLRIMANENMEQWRSSPVVINETVAATKEFLDRELAKYETWDDLNKSIKMLFPTEHSFIQTKNHGVGQTTILKFLGGNWKQWMIQQALRMINDKDIDREVVESFDSVKSAQVFVDKVKKHDFTKDEQREYIDEMKEAGVTSKRDVGGFMEMKAYEKKHPEALEPKEPNQVASRLEVETYISKLQRVLLALPAEPPKEGWTEYKLNEAKGYAEIIFNRLRRFKEND